MMAYSAAGVQMVLIIGIFVFAGRKLDSHFQLEKPWWTLGLAIFGVIVSMTYMLRAFSKITKK
jgi:tryptophan-rich sensory protein